jgi:hypothetical protein
MVFSVVGSTLYLLEFMNKNNLKNQRGTMLILVVFMMSMAFSVAFVASEQVFATVGQHRVAVQSMRSMAAAEAGAEVILDIARKGIFDVSTCNSTNNKYVDIDTKVCVATKRSYEFSPGTNYSVEFVRKTSSVVFSITGSNDFTSRSIKVSY